MLHRSRAFVELAGTEVTILTYEHRDDYDVVRDRLRQRGAMIDGMHIANLWEDLRSWDDDRIRQAAGGFSSELFSEWQPLGDRGDHASELINTLRDDDGEVVQIDYHRPDGTLLGSQHRVPHVSQDGTTRAFTLCDTSGEPLGTSAGLWELYWSWLDSLPRDPVAWFIVDSKTTANHFVEYRRPDTVTMHLVHGSHLVPGTGRPDGTLTRHRRFVMENLEAWDAVIFLTRQQLDEVTALVGPGDNRHVIAHGRHVPAELSTRRRSPYRGVMLTSLTKRKQITHAIKAMNRVGRVRLRRVKLDVWGQGNQEEKLEAAIEKSGSPVRLRGYADHAAGEFERASFSLLTSSNEAFGLVLVESMGHGCIPISYDMPYGPAEIITHGVDGFLVRPDDINGLAREIRRLAGASRSELKKMRRAAHDKATQYNDEHVTARWAELMRAAHAARSRA
jgi:poly(glycerol-phosphate) alpha-glucosyltransferase